MNYLYSNGCFVADAYYRKTNSESFYEPAIGNGTLNVKGLINS